MFVIKAVVLCGGFAKRLWPLTLEKAKPLLEVGGKPIMNYIVEKLEKMGEINEIIISTNAKFEPVFKEWVQKYGFEKLKFVIEGAHSEEEKLGSIAGIDFAINLAKIDEDCIILAGDNIFSFEVRDFIEFFRQKKAPVVAVFDVKDVEKAKGYGIVEIDDKNKIIEFDEKPEQPKSTLASTGCYIFPKDTLKLFSEYLKQSKKKDAPGFFLEWLHKKQDVFGYVFSDYWFDIGNKEALEETRKFMEKKQGFYSGA